MRSEAEDLSLQDQGTVQGCFGCGADNAHGFQLKSFWNGDETVAHFTAATYQRGGSPGMVYGGLIASLIDCHSSSFAIAHYYRAEGRPIGTDPRIVCVTAQLNISFMNPTPLGEELTLVARLRSLEGRKTWVICELSAKGGICSRGEVLLIRLRETTVDIVTE